MIFISSEGFFLVEWMLMPHRDLYCHHRRSIGFFLHLLSVWFFAPSFLQLYSCLSAQQGGWDSMKPCHSFGFCGLSFARHLTTSPWLLSSSWDFKLASCPSASQARASLVSRPSKVGHSQPVMATCTFLDSSLWQNCHGLNGRFCIEVQFPKGVLGWCPLPLAVQASSEEGCPDADFIVH